MRKAPLANKKGLMLLLLLMFIGLMAFGWLVFKEKLPAEGTSEQETAIKEDVQKTAVAEAFRWQLADMYKDPAEAKADELRIEGALKALRESLPQMTQASALSKALAGYYQLQIDLDHLNVYSNLLLDSALNMEEAKQLKTKSEALMGQLAQLEAQLKAAYLDLSDDDMARLRSQEALVPLAERLNQWQADAKWHENVQLSNSLSAFDQLESKLIEPYTSFWKTAKANYNLNDFKSNNDDKRYQATLESQAPEMENSELLASLLEAKVTFDNERAKAYGYSSALELVLAQDGISVESFNALREVVKTSRGVMQRWISYQKAALGLERSLMAHDKQMSWYTSERLDYTEAGIQLRSAVKPYGGAYVELVDQAIVGKWVDVYPRADKSQSAYTWGSYKTHPYVMLQYTDDVYSAATLAHEMGHAMNNEMSRKAQTFDFATNGTLKAEIAATVSELLLLDKLAAHEQEEIAYEAQVEAIKTLSNTLFFQMIATEFEINIHEAAARGEDLSAAYLCETWKALLLETYGPDYEVSELDAYGWAHIDHLYWQYYMYKYTLGAVAGLYIEEKLLEGDQAFTEGYLKLLASGSAEDSLRAFKALGVDLSSPDQLQKAIDNLEDRIQKLEAKSKTDK